VTYEDESSLRFKDFFKYIESRLTEMIDSSVNLENIKQNQLKKSRQASFHQIEDHIEINQNEEGFCHLQVKTSNRVALLLSIANVFKKHQINISNAKITTMGERIEDHFDFKKPHETFSLKSLHDELKKLIS
jgi:[protein-PII] uridylyltransferase